jgi:hypothetical protein
MIFTWTLLMLALAAVCLFVSYCDDIANGTPEERHARAEADKEAMLRGDL